MIVTRPVTPTEPDLLVGAEHKTLHFIGILDGDVLGKFDPPAEGWDHAALERAARVFEHRDPWNAILGDRWVGSSEV